jgi:hypothetical protein
MVNETLPFLLHNFWSESADIHVRTLTPRPPPGSKRQAAGAKSLKLLDYRDGDQRTAFRRSALF